MLRSHCYVDSFCYAPRATMPNKGKSKRRAQRVTLHAQSPCPRKRDQKRKPPPPSPSGLGCARTMTFRYDVDTTESDESLVRWRSRPYKRAASKSTDTEARFRTSNAEGMLHKFDELRRMQKSINSIRANSCVIFDMMCGAFSNDAWHASA